MSQSPMAVGRSDVPEKPSHDVTVIESQDTIQEMFEVLDDADCRDILAATGDEAMSASEVSEACDLPLSTTYRKLDMLTEAGLLEEQTRIRRSGKHPSEYSRLVEDVAVSITTDGGMELQVSRRKDRSQRLSPVSKLGE